MRDRDWFEPSMIVPTSTPTTPIPIPPITRSVPPPVESSPAGRPSLAVVSGSEEVPATADLAATPVEAPVPVAPPVQPLESHAHARRRRDAPGAAMQSLVLLSTMAVMLMLARYSVPGIVEEIRYAWHRGEMRAEYESGGEGLRNVSLDSLSRAYEMVTSAVGPSVVHIDVRRRATDEERRLAKLLGSGSLAISDQGSGVIVDKDGYVLTNRHVIADGVDIHVTLSDGRRVMAGVVGTDTLTDLAVLKINANGLLPIVWGDSQKIRVGSPVWAVGSPFGLDRTVTFGILSGKHRMVRAGERHGSSAGHQDFMQSDVAVNPGNSGGPLVDARGRLVGINTAIVGDTYQGVSFSIPSDVSKRVYERIRETGRVDRGWLGVVLSEVPDELLQGKNVRIRGALVVSLTGGDSPAAIAGLEAGDIVRSVDETPVVDRGHLMRLVGEAPVGSDLKLEVSRNGATETIIVRLTARPTDLE